MIALTSMLPVTVLVTTLVVLLLMLCRAKLLRHAYAVSCVGILLALVMAWMQGVLPLLSGTEPQLLSANTGALTAQHIVMDGFAQLYIGLMLLAGFVCLLVTHAQPNQPDKQTANSLIADKRNVLRLISFFMVLLGAVFILMANSLLAFFVASEFMAFGLFALMLCFPDAAQQERLIASETSTHADDKSPDNVTAPFASLNEQVMYRVLLGLWLLLGIGFLFAYAGGITYSDIQTAVLYDSSSALLLIGGTMLLVTVGYQIACLPLHGWLLRTIRQYAQQVWLPLLLLILPATLLAFVRLLVSTAIPVLSELTILLTILAVIGVLAAATRMVKVTSFALFLAYAVITQVATVILILLALGQKSLVVVNISMVTFMLALIVVAGVMSVLSRQQGVDVSADNTFDGLYATAPKQTLMMSIALSSLAGVPLTAGFFALMFTLLATVQSASWFLMVVYVLASVMLAYAVMMRVRSFYHQCDPASSNTTAPSATLAMRVALAVCLLVLLAVVACGVYPEPLMTLAKTATIML